MKVLKTIQYNLFGETLLNSGVCIMATMCSQSMASTTDSTTPGKPIWTLSTGGVMARLACR